MWISLPVCSTIAPTSSNICACVHGAVAPVEGGICEFHVVINFPANFSVLPFVIPESGGCKQLFKEETLEAGRWTAKMIVYGIIIPYLNTSNFDFDRDASLSILFMTLSLRTAINFD